MTKSMVEPGFFKGDTVAHCGPKLRLRVRQNLEPDERSLRVMGAHRYLDQPQSKSPKRKAHRRCTVVRGQDACRLPVKESA